MSSYPSSSGSEMMPAGSRGIEADPRTRTTAVLLLGLFALSGFTGLVYESIWSHYLKLLLGHAAYAQTLVLAIFMGGMALGAWLASRIGKRFGNPIVAYALIELVIGVTAFTFHPLFTVGTELLWNSGGGCQECVNWGKWLLAGALILPQSVLLGMTFPLMSAGIARLQPRRTGSTIALLYFSNSLGAAVGAVTGVFVLLPAYGLPGTLVFAGTLNLLVATAVYLVVFPGRAVPHLPVAASPEGADRGRVGLLAWAALLTGFASFCYEIAWIRLLSQVLGSTLHAFELMLSAFILGLALGGLWIRHRLDRLADPLRLAALIQVLMAFAALLTLPAYGNLFELMAWLVAGTAKNASGYQLFNVGSHLIALVLMLPATVLAGMTLPLLTSMVVAAGDGERGIGRIYASNTLGAILGIMVAVHLLMPFAGTRLVIGLGALVDLLLGLLLYRRHLGTGHGLRLLPAVAALLLFAAIWPATALDPRRMASGVYRNGIAAIDPRVQVLFHADGKTSSVALLHDPAAQLLTVSNNGKAEAGIGTGGNVNEDEVTMTLLAAIPLALHPGARRVANIGFGTGLTTSVLLASSRVERVDTVEIEPYILTAARRIGPRVERAFSDPRSRIHIEDARAFFAAQQEPYDLVISEPPNPWVSGVASLFTKEFYAQSARSLAPDGLFVQWINMYEFNLELLASVLGAIGGVYADYVLYGSIDTDMMVVASKRPIARRLDRAMLAEAGLWAELAALGFTEPAQLERRYMGNRALFERYFARYRVPANSDYAPLVALQAPRAQFLDQNIGELTALQAAPVVVFGNRVTAASPRAGSVAARYVVEYGVREARRIREFLAAAPAPLPASREVATAAMLLRHHYADCSAEPVYAAGVVNNLYLVAAATGPFLPAGEMAMLWRELRARLCPTVLDGVAGRWLELLGAIAGQAHQRVAALVEQLLPERQVREQVVFLLAAGLQAAANSGDPAVVRAFIARHGAWIPPPAAQPLYLQLLLARLAGD